MCKALLYLICSSLVLATGSIAGGAVFSDDFATAHDYLAAGVAETGWDGFLGLGAGETANAIDASISRDGQLYLESVGASLSEPWSAMPPFLYKVVEGDFIATVKVTEYAGTADAPVYHNNCGLMARATPEDAGAGEDWISVDYFPIWGCGNMVRVANDGARTEPCNNHLAWNAGTYLQLERKGDTFYARVSSDGQTWQQLCDPFVRKDLAIIPLQVGLFQCAYSDAVSYAAFDDFRVESFAQLKATLKSPEDKSRVVGTATLEWIAADNVLAHEVFFGTDPENLDSMGMQTETSYVVEDELVRGTTYYWRIDEIRAKGEITTGDVWSFTAGAPIVATLFPVTETFDAAHDFLVGGVAGTFWDGLVGLDPNETATAITTADANHPGQLLLKSVNAVWSEPWNPLGPFLYKVVKGDFIATVEVTDYAGTSDAWVYHNNAGLMARNVNDADAGAGEDWISVDYFPIWNCGNMVRTADDGVRAEPRNNGKAWNAYKFLQLERKGNTFFARVSADGQTWEQLGDPFVREDFNDLPVQVGLAHATFSDSEGYAAFDNFVLATNSFQDDFSVAHDFVADGVAGTNYDGLVGDIKDVNGVADASMSLDGLLYLESVNAVWSEPWSPLGPFLYKVVSGNFVATVKVAAYAGDPNNWVYHNDCGLMVRNVADADAGPGEDWVSLDYFPIWWCGDFVRSADDGVRSENCNNGQQWALQPYLQIERVGNTFHFRVSADGQTWQELACSPIERKDLDGLSVQVGLHHATFSDSVGYAAFDDFSIVTSQP
ncbi:MAG: hypothetical protein JW955_04475 [Sedimentisphaerales bacterium]|nr:hypothetical protein [Sedimentisphaerales bacterium]